jgi:hypothetical protein
MERKEKLVIGWKVVTRAIRGNGRDLTSAFSSGRVVVYGIDEWTRQPFGCGPLAVFSSKSFALNFAWINTHSVYKCFYVRSFARHLYVNKNRYSNVCLPAGTVFAKKVKLISRVHERIT